MTSAPAEAFLKAQFAAGGFIPRALQSSAYPHLDHFKNSDEYFMARALNVAMNAIGWSAPNPAVGCVLVRNHEIIAEGFTQAYTKEHAEKMAWEQLKIKNITDLSDVAAYVTLEPCSHQGYQPPCVGLFLKSNIQKIVIGTQDPDVRVSGRAIELLTQAGKNVTVGAMEKECRAWHAPFLKTRTQKVFWAAKWAQTPNGFLARNDGTSKWITGPEMRSYTHWLRQKYDAILVGARTWIIDQPSLTVRTCAEPIRRHPLKLIYDPNGRILKDLSHVHALLGKGPLKIFVKEETLKNHLMLVYVKDVEWIGIRSDNPIASLREEIAKLSIQSVMVEGGATLLNELMRQDAFNVVHQMIGKNEFDDAGNQNQVSAFDPSKYFLLTHQKIGDDDLQEWTK